MDDDAAEEDADFEADLEAVEDFSFVLAVVSLGFKALVSGSILMATAPVLWALVMTFLILRCLVSRGGICRVQIVQ